MSAMIMRLLLFDIDGTLLHVRRELTRVALSDVMKEMFAFKGEIDDYEMHGKTDQQIFRELSAIAGVSGDGCHLYEMEQLFIEHATGLGPDDVIVLEGVEALLAELSQAANLRLGIVTGNLERSARLKLDAAGLGRMFPVGAYGSDAHDRGDLPPIAVLRACSHYDCQFAPNDTIIIGDSHRDIACARANGLRAIAVATGVLSSEQLAVYGPDLLLESLTNIDEFMHFVS